MQYLQKISIILEHKGPGKFQFQTRLIIFRLTNNADIATYCTFFGMTPVSSRSFLLFLFISAFFLMCLIRVLKYSWMQFLP